MEVADLIGRNPMPTAILALDEQEVNHRQHHHVLEVVAHITRREPRG